MDTKFEPIGLGKDDTDRQRFVADVIRETDAEFICKSRYNGAEFVLPKYAWREVNAECANCLL